MSEAVTPKKHVGLRAFRRFKESFLKWQLLFGLQEYEVYFSQGDTEGALASIDVNAEGCVAEVKVCERCEEEVDWSATGLHEALHLLFGRLIWMAQRRFVDEDSLAQEHERVVRILERVLR